MKFEGWPNAKAKVQVRKWLFSNWFSC